METTTTTATPYEGGTGGKFQKRPFRRAPATPYDRPASAARVSSLALPAKAQVGDDAWGGRWLSKLVDPASRIVARGASRLFASVFRKRLTAPPGASDINLKSQEEISSASHIIQNSPCDMKEHNHIDEKNAISNHASDSALQEIGSHIDQTFELEQMLKQKTFTRFEFDHLMELLRSRTAEPSTSKPSFSSQEIEKDVLEQENVKQKYLIDRKVMQLAMDNDKKDEEIPPGLESGDSFGLHADNATPLGSLVLREENLGEQTGSPAEIAKAYMGSWCSRRFPGSPSTQKQVFGDDKILYHNSRYRKKPFDHAITPRSISILANPELTNNIYTTPRITGKSATYRMPQPYFKLPLTAKVGSPSVDKYVWPSSPEWTSNGVNKSDGKQARKRGRLVLGDDTSSFGPVRRLRRKCNMMLPSRYSNSSLNYLSSPLTSSRDYKFSIQKPLNLDDQRQAVTELSDAENSAVASARIVTIPPQATETARKILEQLDKLKSSPKGKSSKDSKLKITGKDGSPSMLTCNMLHERALRSMEDIDSSKFQSVHGNNQIVLISDSFHEGLRSSSDQKQDRPQEDGLVKPSVTGVQVTSEMKPTRFVLDVKSSMESSEVFVSNGSISTQKKPSFCISIPEDSLDLVDDEHTTKDSSSAPIVGDEQPEVLPERESAQSKRKKLMNVFEASEVVPSHALVLETKKYPWMQAFDKPVTHANNGFILPTSPTSNNPLQVLPISSIETISLLSESSAPVKVESGDFKFGFGSKQARELSSPSGTDDFGGPADLKSVGSTSTSVTKLGDFKSHKGEKNLMDGELSKSSGNAFLRSSTSSGLSTFAVSATSSMSDGTSSLLSATSSASFVSAMANPGTGMALDFSTSTTIASSTSSSALTAASTFQFGSGHAIAAPSSATASDNSDSLNTEEGSVKLSPLGTKSTTISGTSAAFSNAASNSFAFTSSSVVSGVTSSSLSPAPSFCSSTGTGSSSISASSAPSGSTNSFFSFGAPPQSSGMNLSFPSSNSQIASKSFGFASGYIFSNNGTESAGDSHVLQSPSSQFGSLSSTMFGANGSSSSGSLRSLFESAPVAAKPSLTGSGITSSTTVISSSSSASSTAFTPNVCSASSGFSFTAPSSSNTVFPSTTPFTSSASSSFSSTGAGSSSGSGSSNSFAASVTNSSFNSSSQTSPSTISGAISSTMSSPSTGFSLGLSTTSSGSSPFTFGASSVPTFSFSATGNAASSMSLPSQPVFGVSNQLSPMNSGSPGNDQMNFEDSMADDPVQAPVNTIPTFGTTFGQPTTAPMATPSFVFGSPTVSAAPSTFQFGSQHGNSVPQNQSPFQPTGSSEFATGGSFSLGSGGGGDKSGRKFVRVRRDKLRKK